MTKVHLCTDADNTLWDTNSVYANAQLWMLRSLERELGRAAPEVDDEGLEFVRRIDQEIAAKHHDRLRYPAQIIANALSKALDGHSASEAVTFALADAESLNLFPRIVEGYVERLQAMPKLRSGVAEGLRLAKLIGVPVTVLTEERLQRVVDLVDAHNLGKFIDNVMVINKEDSEYAALRRKFSNATLLMVGDQLDRDIGAAHRAGFATFYFPSGFKPYWTKELESVADHQITRYDEIGPFLGGAPPSLERFD